jgi:hypothetical protein
MEHGGWLDMRSMVAYSHDVPECRRRLVTKMDELALAGGRKTK